MELRCGDRVRFTRNDPGSGLVNGQMAEVQTIEKDGVRFRLEDGAVTKLGEGDPQLRHLDRAWAAAVHAFQGRLCCKIRRTGGELSAYAGARGWGMSDFKGRHFGGEIVLWAVRWYCRYPISYRDLETMMSERSVAVDHSTIYRWVQHFAPEMEKRLRWQWRRPQSRSWRIDETYVKVRGKWASPYRAVDKLGNTIDFFLSSTRNTKAAKRFLGKALRGMKDWELPEVSRAERNQTRGRIHCAPLGWPPRR